MNSRKPLFTLAALALVVATGSLQAQGTANQPDEDERREAQAGQGAGNAAGSAGSGQRAGTPTSEECERLLAQNGAAGGQTSRSGAGGTGAGTTGGGVGGGASGGGAGGGTGGGGSTAGGSGTTGGGSTAGSGTAGGGSTANGTGDREQMAMLEACRAQLGTPSTQGGQGGQDRSGTRD